MKKKQKKMMIILSVVLIVTLIFVAYIFFNGTTSSTTISSERIEAFSKCLTEKKVVMYGSTRDSNSLAQMQMFGNSFKNLFYIDCMEKQNDCSDILIFPSWKINNKIIHGAVSLEVLSKLTECEL